MRLAIIGAGVAGLAAARELRRTWPDLEVTIFEKSRGFGGRASTRRREGFAFDHGAQVIKAPTEAMRCLLLEDLPADDLRRVASPVWTFDAAGTLAEGDPALNAEPSYCYRDGNSRLGKLLAEGLDVRREVRIASLRRPRTAEAAWELIDTEGRAVGAADAALLTAPAPQSAEIVAASDLEPDRRVALAAALGRGTYRRCLSIALAYGRPVDRPFYALVNGDRRHPVAWLALEHAKGPERCPPGHSLLIAQMAPQYSLERWDAPAEDVAREAAELVSGLLGEDLRSPLWADRQGWRYALPDSPADTAALDAAAADRLFFAGDFAAGLGRVHLAYESGLRAAEMIRGLRGLNG